MKTKNIIQYLSFVRVKHVTQNKRLKRLTKQKQKKQKQTLKRKRRLTLGHIKLKNT